MKSHNYHHLRKTGSNSACQSKFFTLISKQNKTRMCSVAADVLFRSQKPILTLQPQMFSCFHFITVPRAQKQPIFCPSFVHEDLEENSLHVVQKELPCQADTTMSHTAHVPNIKTAELHGSCQLRHVHTSSSAT